MLKTTRFVVENMTDSSTFDNPAPRYGCSLESDRLNVCVKEASILVNVVTIDATGRMGSVYDGKPLQPYTRYTATISVHYNYGTINSTGMVPITSLADILYVIGFYASDGSIAFFFNYINGDMKVLTIVNLVTGFASMFGMVLPPILANKFGKNKLMAGGMLIFAAASQPQPVSTGVSMCSIVFPLIFCLVGGLLFMFCYKLDKKKVDEMAEAVTAW